MMKQALSTLILLIMVLTSCKQEERKGIKPMVTGKPGEILLVIDPHHWESPIGNFFREFSMQPFPALPQDEPRFRIINIPNASFNKIFRTHRNVILTKISDQWKEPRLLVQEDIWAYPQLVINVIGPDDATMTAYLEEQSEKLKLLLERNERNRMIQNYRKNKAKGIDEMLQARHQVSISVPAGYDLSVDTTNFVWLSHEVADMTQSILIYFFPYTDTNTFTPEYLRAKRDEFTRRYVAGPRKGSYMRIEDQFPVEFREMSRNDEYMIEMRGLWRLENAFMGGPFVSHVMLDEKRNRVVVADGFVYAPSLDKGNYVRELEAILHTFRIVDSNQ